MQSSNPNPDEIRVGNIENSQGIAIGAGATAIVGYTADQVSALLAQVSTTFRPKPFDGRSPYVGLAAFQETDADRFFGREKLVGELVARVKSARAIFVAGPSGSGKSSLMRAGVMHALRSRGVQLNTPTATWLYETMQPGRAPLDELVRVVSRWTNSVKAGDEFRACASDSSMFHRWADMALGDARDRRAILLIDQFEEIFTQVPREREAERIAFLNLLTHAATVENGRVSILFALRSDFVSHCATYPQLNALLNQQFLQVGAMTPDELVSAIAQPALRVGLQIDPDLIAQIVNEMRDAPNALPLMQFALDDLFQAQRAKGDMIALTLQDYFARGGLHKALERHADTAFARLTESEQKIARTIFAGVIEIGRGTADTRRTALFDELVPAGTDVAQAQNVTQKLATARLLATDERDGKETVTLAHERLIDAWQWLRHLVDENREAITLQNQIAEDARKWDVHKRDASYHYTGARLATVREQLDAKKIVLSGLAQEFVKAGIWVQESGQRTQRRLLVSTIALLVLTLLAIGTFVIVALQQNSAVKNEVNARATEVNTRATAEALVNEQTRISESRRLTVQSNLSYAKDLDISLLLAVEAVKLDLNLEARNNLLTSIQQTHLNSTFRGHTASVSSVTFSPDGKMLASGSINGTIRLWEVASGKPIGQPLTGYSGAVLSVAFSPDGKTLAAGSANGTIWLWEVASGKPLGQLLTEPSSSVSIVAFSPDGKTLASRSADTTIQLWEVASGKPVGQPLTGPSRHVSSIALSPDGKTFASGSLDTTIQLWEVASGKLLGQPLAGHSSSVSSIAFSPDGKTLASGSLDTTIQLWEVASGKPLGQPLMGHSGSVYSVAFSPDGKTLASGSLDNTIRLWEVASGKPIGQPLAGHSNFVSSVAFSPDGKTLASGSGDRTIRLWEVASGKPIGQPLTGHSDAVLSVTFSPNGKALASGSADRTIRLWEVASDKPIGQPLMGHSDAVLSVAFSPDGKTLASRSADTTIRLWEISSGKPIGQPLTGHSSHVFSIAFSPDGKTLASGSADRTIRLWEVASGKPIGQPLMEHSDAVLSIAFSPDGKTLASGSLDTTIQLWEVASGKPIGQPLMGHSDAVLSVTFRPDGKTLASMSADTTIRLWEVASGKPIGQPLTGHSSHVFSIAFSPDGKTLASGSADRTIRLWEVASSKPIGQPLIGHSDAVLSVAFSPDGKTLVSGSYDGTIELWDVNLESWKALACRAVNRNLTRGEWIQYINQDASMYDTIYAKEPTCPGLPVEPVPTPTPQPTRTATPKP